MKFGEDFKQDFSSMLVITLLIIGLLHTFFPNNEEEIGFFYNATSVVEISPYCFSASLDIINLYEKKIHSYKHKISYAQVDYGFMGCDIPKDIIDYIEKWNGSLYDYSWEENYDKRCLDSLMEFSYNKYLIKHSEEQIDYYENRCLEVEDD